MVKPFTGTVLFRFTTLLDFETINKLLIMIRRSTQYYDNSQLHIETYYNSENQLSVSWTEYYKNGQCRGIIPYQLNNGKRHGLLIQWDERGNIEAECQYDNDKIVENSLKLYF